MTSKKLSIRKKRAKQMARLLERLFPGRQKTILKYKNPWELLVSVELSAQCTDKKVNEVTATLFKRYKKIEDYVQAKPSEFEKLVKPTGFYKNKTKNILSAARRVKDKFGGKVPKTMEDLLTLPGVARKTANVIQWNAFKKVEGIAVDTHVRRFALKFDLTDSSNPVIIERDLMEILPKNEWADFTYRLISYGREICAARKHDCSKHPLSKIYPPAANNFPSR